MDKEKRNQNILVTVVVLLLIGVVGASVVLGVEEEKKSEEEIKIIFDQLYNSDYDLHPLGDKYFFGTYDNKLNVFIDMNGKEIFKTDEEIVYDGYYKTLEGNYLFYNNVNDMLNVYVFDGKSLSLYYSFEDVKYVKPIVNNDVIMGFTSFVDDKTYLYSLDNEGFTTLGDVTLLADKFRNNIYYSNSNKHIVVNNSDNLYGVINISGEYIVDCKYNDIITLSNGNFIVKDDKDKYGIVDNAGNILVKNSYDGIIPYGDYYLLIKDNKMALYDKEYNAITKFSQMNYNKIVDFNYRDISSVKFYDIGENLVIINNFNASKYDYKNHNMYIIKNGKYVDHEYQIGFYSDDKITYSFDSQYNIKFYNNDMKVIHEFMLSDVKSIKSVSYYNDNTVSIKCIDDNDEEVTKLYNYEGNVVEDSEKVILSNSMYYVIEKDNKLIIKDFEGNELSYIVGNVKVATKDYLIVDHILYRIVIE